MEDFSEEGIKKHCPHCDTESSAFQYPLLITDNFSIVCDVNPIIEGHLLIIPKRHISCIGEYPPNLFKEFLDLRREFSEFLLNEYGSISTFEHGKFGQTVFHSHVHLLPFRGKALDVVSEGENQLFKIKKIKDLKTLYKKDGGYLFFSIGENMWTVDLSLTAPRFFRDRFAKALGRPERGNWKEMRVSETIRKITAQEAIDGQSKWRKWILSQPKNKDFHKLRGDKKA